MTQGWQGAPGQWPPPRPVSPGQGYGGPTFPDDQLGNPYGPTGQYGPAGQPGYGYQPVGSPYGPAQPVPPYGSTSQPPGQPKRRRRRSATFWLLFVLPTLLLLGGTGFALAPLRNGLPLPTVTRVLPNSIRVPGTALQLPWPATGQAALEVDGLGKLGSSGNTDKAVPIASVAKVMTAYIILADHPINPGENGASFKITPAQASRYPQEQKNGESLVPISAGMTYTERQALIAVLLPSANNMARILGEWDAGSQDDFVAKMNQTAATLGMANSHYTDPAGYDPGTVSTATDQVLLAKKAMAIPAFAEIAKMTEAQLPGSTKVTNYNELVGENGVVGIKTGSTDEAGGCLMFAAQLTVGGKQIMIVGAVLGQPGQGTPKQLQAVFAATRQVLQAATKSLIAHTVAKAGQTIATITGPLGAQTALNADQDLTIVGWPGLDVQVTLDVPQVPASLPASSEVGALSASTGQAKPASTKLRSTVRLDQPSVWSRIRHHR